MKQMMEHQVDEFYYITLMNENSAQPSVPENVSDSIIKGLYRISCRGEADSPLSVRLVGSGTILKEVIAAADLLYQHYGISSEIFSATSFSELAREARALERRDRLMLDSTEESHIQKCLPGDNPIIAATDYVVALPQLIAPYVSARFVALGTDGFGRSDQRAVLRDFFEVDSKHIVITAIESLVKAERVDRKVLQKALNDLAVTAPDLPPWLR
jgi:pyruvate dehydrogenase E1 component